MHANTVEIPDVSSEVALRKLWVLHARNLMHATIIHIMKRSWPQDVGDERKTIFCTHCGQNLYVKTARLHVRQHWLQDEHRWRSGFVPGRTEFGRPCEPESSPFEHDGIFAPPFGESNISAPPSESEPYAEESDISFDSELDAPLLDSDSDSDGIVEIPINPQLEEASLNVDSILPVDDRRGLYLALLLWQSAYSVSSKAMSVLLYILWLFFSSSCAIMTTQPTQTGNPYLPVLKDFMQDLDNNILQCACACPSCYKVYELKETYDETFNVRTRKRLRYPKICTAPYCVEPLSKITTRQTIRPILPIYYSSIAEQLRRQIKTNPHFVAQCNAWRRRDLPDHVLADVYDGDLWKSFREEFFDQSKLNFGFWLNVDWFQPFVRSLCSKGVVYLVNMNLPRRVRMLKENVLAVGVWPDVGEHTRSGVAFLDQLVTQLEQLYVGVPLDPDKPDGDKIRAVLLFVCADVPAARCIGGLTSCTSTSGCHMCDKKFHGEDSEGGGYGGFAADGSANNQHNARTDTDQRLAAQEWKALDDEFTSTVKPPGWQKVFKKGTKGKLVKELRWTKAHVGVD